MKFLNLITGLFCLYIIAGKSLFLIAYEASTPITAQTDFVTIAQQMKHEADFTFAIIWLGLFSTLLLIWVWIFTKKKEKMKPWLAATVLLFALIMNITDNLEYSVHVSDTIIGTEIIEQNGGHN